MLLLICCLNGKHVYFNLSEVFRCSFCKSEGFSCFIESGYLFGILDCGWACLGCLVNLFLVKLLPTRCSPIYFLQLIINHVVSGEEKEKKNFPAFMWMTLAFVTDASERDCSVANFLF